jgi:hypothetical protein
MPSTSAMVGVLAKDMKIPFSAPRPRGVIGVSKLSYSLRAARSRAVGQAQQNHSGKTSLFLIDSWNLLINLSTANNYVVELRDAASRNDDQAENSRLRRSCASHLSIIDTWDVIRDSCRRDPCPNVAHPGRIL